MINLLVDEAYAFDYLAILMIKSELYSSKEKYETYIECYNNLKLQIEYFDNIIKSLEFIELYEINKKVFILIDNLRNGENISAKEIDDANIDRFYKKQALQKRYFNNELSEEKIFPK